MDCQSCAIFLFTMYVMCLVSIQRVCEQFGGCCIHCVTCEVEQRTVLKFSVCPVQAEHFVPANPLVMSMPAQRYHYILFESQGNGRCNTKLRHVFNFLRVLSSAFFEGILKLKQHWSVCFDFMGDHIEQ